MVGHASLPHRAPMFGGAGRPILRLIVQLQFSTPAWVPQSFDYLKSTTKSDVDHLCVGDSGMVLGLRDPVDEHAWKMGRVSLADSPLASCNSSIAFAWRFVDDLWTYGNNNIGRDFEAPLKAIYEGCMHDVITCPLKVQKGDSRTMSRIGFCYSPRP